MKTKSLESMKRMVRAGLRQGISPERLALTIALGLSIGCLPVVGIPTVICAALALVLHLNLPAIQAANYAVMPLQVALILPFVKLGGHLIRFGSGGTMRAGALLHTPPLELMARMGGMAGQALLAWLLVAVPAVLLLTAMLTPLLRRVPAVAAAEAGD